MYLTNTSQFSQSGNFLTVIEWYGPNNGTASDVAGIVSATMLRNTVSDKRIVTPKDSFSPESGGNVNPSTAIEAISTHGTIRLKK